MRSPGLAEKLSQMSGVRVVGAVWSGKRCLLKFAGKRSQSPEKRARTTIVPAHLAAKSLPNVDRFRSLLRGTATDVEVVTASRKSGLNRNCAWGRQSDWRRKVERPGIRPILADGASVCWNALPFDGVTWIS